MAKAKSLVVRRKARKAYERAVKKNKPGGGARFRALESEAAKGGASNPAAVAAAAGRKKYGREGMARLSAMGKRGGKRGR